MTNKPRRKMTNSKKIKTKRKNNGKERKSNKSKYKTNKNSSEEEIFEFTKQEIKNAIKILNTKDNRKPLKIAIARQQSHKCKLPIYVLQENQSQIHNTLTAMSSVNVTRHMRHAILTHDWSNLTKLLIVFFDAKQQDAIKLRNAFVNLFNNPTAIQYNFLDEFLQMFISCQSDEDKLKFIDRLLTLNIEDSKDSGLILNNIVTEIILDE